MDDIYKSFLRQFSGINEILESQRRWQEEIRALTTPLLERWKEMESWVMPYRRFQEDMRRWAEPYRQIQDEIRNWVEAQQKLQEQMQRFIEPYRQLQEQMQKIVEPYQRWQQEIQKLLTPSTTLGNYVMEAARLRYSVPELEMSISGFLDGINEESLWVDNSGTITVGEDTVSREEFANTFTQTCPI